jgi:hypothetical protein
MDDLTRTQSAASDDDDTQSAYQFAIEEVRVASSNLGRALLAHALTRGAFTCRLECSDARSVYDRMINTKVQLDARQRDLLLYELALLRSRLEECED